MKNPPGGTWISQIETARSAAELVRLLREYLESMSPEERVQLPSGCSAEDISRAADIQEWAVTLAHADLKATASEGSTDALHQAAVVFAAGGARLPKVAE